MTFSTGVAMAQDQIAGTYLGPGVECPQFRMTTGEQISLRGDGLDDLTIGAPFQMTGQFLRVSPCMQGRAFHITSLTAASNLNDN
jgi:hypothetical protein